MTRYAVLGTSGSTDGGGWGVCAPLNFFGLKHSISFLKITYTSTGNTSNDFLSPPLTKFTPPSIQILDPPLLDQIDGDNFVQTDYAFCPAANFEYMIYLNSAT